MGGTIAKGMFFFLILVVVILIALYYLFFSNLPLEISPHNYLVLSIEKTNIEESCLVYSNSVIGRCPNGDYYKDGKVYDRGGVFLNSKDKYSGNYESVIGLIDRVVLKKSIGCAVSDLTRLCK